MMSRARCVMSIMCAVLLLGRQVTRFEAVVRVDEILGVLPCDVQRVIVWFRGWILNVSRDTQFSRYILCGGFTPRIRRQSAACVPPVVALRRASRLHHT